MKGLVSVIIAVFFFLSCVSLLFAEAPTLEDVVRLIGPCDKQVISAARVKQGIEFLEKKRSDRPVGITISEVSLAVVYMISQDILAIENKLATFKPGVDPSVIAELKNQLAELKGQNAVILAAIKSASDLSTLEHQQIRNEIRALAGKVDDLACKLCGVLHCMLETLGALSDKLDRANELLIQIAADTKTIREEQIRQGTLLGKVNEVGLDTNDRVRWLVKMEEDEADYPDCLSVLFGAFFRVKEQWRSQFREPTLEINARLPLGSIPIYANGSLGGLPFFALGALDLKLDYGPHSVFAGGGCSYLPSEKVLYHGFLEVGYKYKRIGCLARFFPFEPKGKRGVEILFRGEIF